MYEHADAVPPYSVGQDNECSARPCQTTGCPDPLTSIYTDCTTTRPLYTYSKSLAHALGRERYVESPNRSRNHCGFQAPTLRPGMEGLPPPSPSRVHAWAAQRLLRPTGPKHPVAIRIHGAFLRRTSAFMSENFVPLSFRAERFSRCLDAASVGKSE